jgi:uncharacterized protein YbbC (DUF1343 family)
VALLDVFRRAGGPDFAWREPPYEYEHTIPPIDILYGSASLRERLEAGVGAREIAREWEPGIAAFEPSRSRFLLY